MTEPKHSPTPWIGGSQDSRKFPILAAPNSHGLRDNVADFLQLEDRDYALRAVNHYRNLVSIAFRVGLTKCSCPMLRNCIHNAAKTAWKKAEGIEDETLDLQGD